MVNTMKITRYASATEIELSNGTAVLVSYSTPVAAIVYGAGTGRYAIVADEKYSRTTTKHIEQFLSRHGLASRVEVPQSNIARYLDGTALNG